MSTATTWSFAALALVLALPRSAQAADADADTRQLTVAESFIPAQAAASKQARYVESGTAIGAGVTSAAIGAVLIAKDASATAVIIVAQGGMTAGFGALALFSLDPYEELARDLGSILAERTGARERVLALDERWATLATKARRQRILRGAILVTTGALLTAAGATAAFAPARTFEFEGNKRGLYTQILLGAGLTSAAAGLVSLLARSHVERGLEAFRLAGAPSRVGVAPAGMGGLLFSWSGRF